MPHGGGPNDVTGHTQTAEFWGFRARPTLLMFSRFSCVVLISFARVAERG